MKIKVKRPAGTLTTYPSFDAWRQYIYGEISLQEYRQVRSVYVVTQLYADREIDVPVLPFALGLVVGAILTLLWCT